MRLEPFAWLCVALAAACTHEPRTPAGSPSPSQPAAALPVAVTPPSPPPTGLPDAKTLAWAGDPGFPSPRPGQVQTLMGKDSDISFIPGKDDRSSRIVRRQSALGNLPSDVMWDHKLPDEFISDATLLPADGALYVAHYSAISDGATIHALDLATGAERWATAVHGLGGVAHSKYANHVALAMVQGALVVFGNESGGRYIEVFDPVTGKMTSTRIVPVVRP